MFKVISNKYFMKKAVLKILVSVVILLCISTNTAKAYDFSAVNSDGDTLYYNITDSINHTVFLTYKNCIYGTYITYNSDYSISGMLTIPSSVTHSGITYNIIGIGEYAFHGCTGLTAVKISKYW